MTAPLYTFTINDPNTIRDNYLRVVANGLRALGVVNPNVGPGSDYYVQAVAFAAEASVAEANSVLLADELLPDTASIDGLTRHGAILGLQQRPAVGSTGPLVLSASASTTVVAGSILTDAAGQQYQTTTTAIVAPGGVFPVRALLGGSMSNHAAGDTLTWQSAAPAYANTTALVAVGGLVGGSDAEDTETYRSRILATYASPPGNGNAQYVMNATEASTPTVQKSFVYPAVQGPGTVHIAVAGYATATSKTRDVPSTIINTIVAPYLAGQIPEHVYSLVTSVQNQPVDVAVSLSLPASPNASPPGPGGGWLDGQPWPALSGSGFTSAPVTAVTSSTQFTVSAPTSPIAGASSISWLSPFTWTIYSAVVTSVASAGTNLWAITVSTPFPGIAIGNFIFPTAANTASYIATILAQFALMGPGEKTGTAAILTRSYRRPVPQFQYPYALSGVQMKALTDSAPEVLTAQYLFIGIGGVAGSSMPNVPTDVTTGPYIFVPGNLAFYPL